MRAAMLVVLGALTTPALAAGQEVQDTEIVIVTAPLEGSRIESLQGAAVLNRDEIVSSLSGGLGDTLDHLPGVASTFYGAGASRPIIRGLGDDRVRVLQNGVGAIDASAASPDHAVTADGLDATRIEVLRGAAALAYGGNAIGGVVNVIDQSIPTRAVEGAEGDALAGYSSGDRGGELAAGVTFGAGAFAGRLSAAARTTEDYETPIGDMPNSDTEYRTLGAGGGFVGDWGHIGLAVKRTESNYGLPPHGEHEDEDEHEEEHEEHAPEAGGRIDLEQTRIELRGDFRINLGAFDRLDFALQSSDYQHTEFEADGEAGTVFTNEGWEGRVEAHHNGFGERLDGAIGVQAIDTDFAAIGEEGFITPTNTRDLGVFAVERLDFGGYGFEAGARYETREVDNEGGGVRDFDAVSGSVGAFVRPATNWFAGLTFARTERAPTAIELFADGPHHATESYEIGNADLEIETATSFEISARYTTAGVAFELNLYQVKFDDYVALTQRGDFWWADEESEAVGFAPSEDDASIPEHAEVMPVYIFIADDATFTGGEISARARLFEAHGFAFSADAALDLVRAEFDSGGRPPRIPPRTTTLGFEAENTRFDARLEWVDTADQGRVAEFETPTPGHQFWNARLAYRPLPEGALTFLIDARNLTDELARAHTSFLKDDLPLPGRHVRFAVTTRF